jgi:regulatory protein
MPNNQKELIREAKIKMARFCSYRERAPEEVRMKLAEYNLNEGDMEQIMKVLIEQDFVNERRFARAYANGKLRINKWGKLKIKQGLEHFKVDPDRIEEALHKLPQDQYQTTLIKHIEKKLGSLKDTDPFVRNHKAAQFVISKGFEPELVWRHLKANI